MRIFGFFWRLLDAGRRVVFNLLFLLLLVVLIGAWVANRTSPLQDNTTLVLDLKGALVEQKSGSASGSLLAQVRGESGAAIKLEAPVRGIILTGNTLTETRPVEVYRNHMEWRFS